MKVLIVGEQFIPEVTEPQWRAAEQIAQEAGAEVVIARDRETQLVEVEDADCVFGRVTPEMLARAKKLRWLQSVGAGQDAQLYQDFIASPVTLTSEKGNVGPHLAEHAIGLTLALTRGINTAIRVKDWSARVPIRVANWELTDKTMFVVGLGGTGVEVARRAVAFGMEVLAMDPEPVEQPPFVKELHGLDRFHDLLGRSDVVVITAPLAPSSKAMFNRAAFAAMRRDSYLINVSRGEVVELEALINALREGQIRGAGLDVTPIEPLPKDNPLWAMDNVIITFHTAGSTPLRGGRIVERFRRNLHHFINDEPLEGVIDKVKGY